MGAQGSACHRLADPYCPGDGRIYQVRCAVQRVALHRKQQVGALNRLFGPSEQQVYVEVGVERGSSSGSKKTSCVSAQACRTEAGKQQHASWDLWTWDGVAEENAILDGKKENGRGGIVTLQALASSRLSVQVIAGEVVAVGSKTSCMPGHKDVPPRVLGEAQLSIQEDIIASIGTSGEFTWPLVLDNLVCGSIGLFVTLKSDDVLRLDCARTDDQVFLQDALETVQDVMYGKMQRSASKGSAVGPEKQHTSGVSMQFLGKEMIVSHVCVQNGSIGVKVGPVRISPALMCLKVLHLNDEARAESLGIGKGDLLYGIDGGIFSEQEDFMMRLKMPPYLLTVLRA